MPVELIVNGCGREADVIADGQLRELKFERRSPFELVGRANLSCSHTNLAFIHVDGKPIRAQAFGPMVHRFGRNAGQKCD